MFREVMLVEHRPGQETKIEVVRARPVGRPYAWLSETTPDVGGFFLIFEGEDGSAWVQEITRFPEPSSLFAKFLKFASLEEVRSIFPREAKFVEGEGSEQATFFPEPLPADRA